MQQCLKINGVQIKTPKPGNFDWSSYNLTKSGRLASGLMTMDFIAKKRKFEFSYDSMSSTDLELILSLIDNGTMFFTFEYVDDNEAKSAIVYVGDISRTPQRTGAVWWWKNVKFDFIEQ